MFSKLAVVFVSIAAAAAAAAPASTTATAVPVTATGNVCNIGVLECCDSIQPPQSAGVQSTLKLLNLGADYTGPGFVGLQCTPIRNPTNGPSRFGCNNNLACCEKSEKNGVIAVGCTSTNVRV